MDVFNAYADDIATSWSATFSLKYTVSSGGDVNFKKVQQEQRK